MLKCCWYTKDIVNFVLFHNIVALYFIIYQKYKTKQKVSSQVYYLNIHTLIIKKNLYEVQQ